MGSNIWTNKEMSAISQLKERLQDLDLSNPILEDRRLINWLRARELRVSDAEIMLRKHLEWREENKIDTILTSGIVPVDDPMLATLPVDVVGHDKDGNTILAVYSGSLDIKKVVQYYGREMSLNVIYYMLETAYADIVNQSTDPKVLKKADYIADMDGIRFKDYLSSDVLDVLIQALKVVEANYPEILNKAFVFNAPFIFPALWNILKPFMSPATLEKVHILGYNQEKIEKCLLEIIPVDQLPRRWGGTGFSERVPGLNVSSSSSSKSNIADKDLCEVVISAGESIEISFDVECPKVLISWSFKTKQYDIGFSLVHKPFEVMSDRNSCATEKVEYKRINCQKALQSGSLVCDTAGHYILRFDNTYSRLREKTLLYIAEMTQLTTNGNNEDDHQGTV